MNAITALKQQLLTNKRRVAALNKVEDLLKDYSYEQFQAEANADTVALVTAYVALRLMLDEASSLEITFNP